MQKISTLIAFGILLALTGCQDKEHWIDVRSLEEFNTGHLEEAIVIPHTEIAQRISEVTTNKDALIHVYCRSGNRSGQAKVALEALGYTNVINEGGYEDILEKRKAQ